MIEISAPKAQAFRFRATALATSLTLAFAAAACGSAADGTVGVVTQSALDTSGLRGSWYRSETNETVDFADSGSFTSTACAARGTVTNLDSKAQTFQILNFSVGAGNCQPPADRSCSYAIDGKTLTLTCSPDGGGTYIKP
jgi:hypothetical protein